MNRAAKSSGGSRKIFRRGWKTRYNNL